MRSTAVGRFGFGVHPALENVGLFAILFIDLHAEFGPQIDESGVGRVMVKPWASIVRHLRGQFAQAQRTGVIRLDFIGRRPGEEHDWPRFVVSDLQQSFFQMQLPAFFERQPLRESGVFPAQSGSLSSA